MPSDLIDETKIVRSGDLEYCPYTPEAEEEHRLRVLEKGYCLKSKQLRMAVSRPVNPRTPDNYWWQTSLKNEDYNRIFGTESTE
jgi:hypothetical protein